MSGVKERPIIFSGPMVQAILTGRKDQTRRVVKPENLNHNAGCIRKWLDAGELGEHLLRLCPYGKPGSRLWVKEAIRRGDWEARPDFYHGGIQYAADGEWMWDVEGPCQWVWPKRKMLPAMFMNRGMSRITLELTAVRVERVQDISEADAEAEGVEPIGVPVIDGGTGEHLGDQPSYRYGFSALWDSLNARRGYPFSSNAWVWVLGFRRLT